MWDPETDTPTEWGGRRKRAGRPRSMNPRVSFTIQIPKELKESIRREAERDGISLSRAAENRLKR